jgi:hypothetical protein
LQKSFHLLQRKRKIELKNFHLFKKTKKYATRCRHPITRQLNNDNGLQALLTERRHLIAVWQKWRCSTSHDSFVVKIATCAKP